MDGKAQKLLVYLTFDISASESFDQTSSQLHSWFHKNNWYKSEIVFAIDSIKLSLIILRNYKSPLLASLEKTFIFSLITER